MVIDVLFATVVGGDLLWSHCSKRLFPKAVNVFQFVRKTLGLPNASPFQGHYSKGCFSDNEASLTLQELDDTSTFTLGKWCSFRFSVAPPFEPFPATPIPFDKEMKCLRREQSGAFKSLIKALNDFKPHQPEAKFKPSSDGAVFAGNGLFLDSPMFAGRLNCPPTPEDYSDVDSRIWVTDDFAPPTVEDYGDVDLRIWVTNDLPTAAAQAKALNEAKTLKELPHLIVSYDSPHSNEQLIRSWGKVTTYVHAGQENQGIGLSRSHDWQSAIMDLAELGIPLYRSSTILGWVLLKHLNLPVKKFDIVQEEDCIRLILKEGETKISSKDLTKKHNIAAQSVPTLSAEFTGNIVVWYNAESFKKENIEVRRQDLDLNLVLTDRDSIQVLEMEYVVVDDVPVVFVGAADIQVLVEELQKHLSSSKHLRYSDGKGSKESPTVHFPIFQSVTAVAEPRAHRSQQLSQSLAMAPPSSLPIFDALIETLQELVPLQFHAEGDNVGLLLDCPDAKAWREVDQPRQIFLTNDLSEQVLAEALSNRASLILTYHPTPHSESDLPMDGLHRTTHVGRILLTLLRNRIPVYSTHTAHDSHEGGPNDWLLAAFGDPNNYFNFPTRPASMVKKPNVMMKLQGAEGKGLGRVAILNDPISIEHAVDLVKKHLKLPTLLRADPQVEDGSRDIHSIYRRPHQSLIEKVAVSAGSGWSAYDGLGTMAGIYKFFCCSSSSYLAKFQTDAE